MANLADAEDGHHSVAVAETGSVHQTGVGSTAQTAGGGSVVGQTGQAGVVAGRTDA